MTFAEHLTQATDITLNFTQVIKINFQPDDFAVPEGYIKDSGKPYSEAHGFGFGWVREDSLDKEIATPLDIRKNARDRKQAGIDPHLNTLLHMQYPQNSSSSKGVKVAAAWQCTIPNGTYNVTVSVGDATASDSVHQINIQGQPVISSFQATETKKFFSITRLVTVSDGKLTIDAKGGTNTKINYVVIAPGNRPSVRITNIADAETGVPPVDNISISADVNLPNSGIDRNTLTKHTVKLIDTSTGTPVDSEANTSAAGDVIALTATSPLKPKTKYIFEVTDGVKDSNEEGVAVSFWPYSMSFTTGEDFSRLSTIVFEQVRLENVPSKPYSTVAIGSDKQLYAATLLGEILRFPINDDGTVGTPQTITSVQEANGGPRSIIGMCFDSSSTPDNLVLWISNNYFWDGGQQAPEWSGKLTKLSGPNLETVQDYVINLPRSIRDHMTNSITCNPNEPNVLYVMQASNTAMGAPDKAWGKRPERLLTAAVLRVDLSKITSPPLSVKTEEEGTYDPFAPDAAVTIFASGVRNAYDCTWHSNGQLYIATNGSAAGGNTPGTPNPLPSEGQVRIDKAIRGLLPKT